MCPHSQKHSAIHQLSDERESRKLYNKLRDLVRGTNRPVLQGSREIYDVTGSQGVLYRPSNAVRLQVSCTVGKSYYETGLELEKNQFHISQQTHCFSITKSKHKIKKLKFQCCFTDWGSYTDNLAHVLERRTGMILRSVAALQM